MIEGRLLARDDVYRGRRINLRVDTIELPSGRKTTREVVGTADAVAIVALDSEDRAVLVRQYRSAVGQVLLEIPAGKVEAGESALECVQRELGEETGLVPRRVEHLGGFYAGPGYSTEFLQLYCATELHPAGRHPDPDEILEVVRIPLGEIPAMIACGEIRDAKSIAGLLRVIVERGGGPGAGRTPEPDPAGIGGGP